MHSDDVARELLGVRFVHQGRNPKSGIDCIGAVIVWGTRLGLPFVALDTTNYGRDPHDGMLESYLESAFGPSLHKSQMQAGDVVSVDYFGVIRHVGIVAQGPGYLTLIHTNQRVGRVTEARIDPKWLKRIKGVYRPQEVA